MTKIDLYNKIMKILDNALKKDVSEHKYYTLKWDIFKRVANRDKFDICIYIYDSIKIAYSDMFISLDVVYEYLIDLQENINKENKWKN
ncbi:hypothetical protein [Helicobacter sp. WB40]|uniref:hypothetical protein n=1 Tax=Helicobacter sp. WB40 TaxID=3004130 RepID=UPI0022EBF8A6|nr:hypothetical protein [Helicobacter sp. WB40]MDA3966646.1 hypothetical protein [Helicobacter sp. WB40]